MKIGNLTCISLFTAALAASPLTWAAHHGDDHSDGGMSAMEEKESMGSESMTGDGMAMEAPKFDRLDANGDGQLSADELNVYGSTAAGSETGTAVDLDMYDSNGDGSLSREEYQRGTMPTQDPMDNMQQ
ncbi:MULTISPECIES: EF-hand domain-containing protein [Marinobacter]|uniref:EF-hand domain-containing protein n=1 Tax=Marinobacter TaxID=2742 RepID=UPI001D070E20|nr:MULTISPECIES: EF-hand domain-containing protein [Marinobacter]MCK7565388.1 EF-hand domain-containing protein [Marinobacter xestospongiae]UDL07294.1 EF-hand domain-containing protein [Marinobacter sp. CA1]